MASTRILRIPYCFKASIVERRHRNPTEILLRDETPAEIAVLTSAEAPVRLRARLETRGDHQPVSLNIDISLRHDGRSYLRAIHHIPDLAETKGRPFTLSDFEDMLAWRSPPFPAYYGEHDRPKGILTTLTRDLQYWVGARLHDRRPEEIPTPESIAPVVREWLFNPHEEARLAAIRAIDGFALVDGHLHHRVAAPVATLTEKGSLRLHHSDQIASRMEALGIHSDWVPIVHARSLFDLPGYCNSSTICEVDAPLETPDDAGLAFTATTIFDQVSPVVYQAVTDMDDVGMEAFRTFRAASAPGAPHDLPSLINGVEALRTMTRSRSFSEADPTLSMRSLLHRKLAVFDAVAAHCTPKMDADDEKALSKFSV